MKPGDPLPPRRLTVEAAAMPVLARILHDTNPIHLDPAAARAAGLGNRVVNQGPANLAFVLDMLASALPDHRIGEYQARFLGNVFGGDAVEAGGELVAVHDGRIICSAWLRRAADDVVLTVEATMVAKT